MDTGSVLEVLKSIANVNFILKIVNFLKIAPHSPSTNDRFKEGSGFLRSTSGVVCVCVDQREHTCASVRVRARFCVIVHSLMDSERARPVRLCSVMH